MASPVRQFDPATNEERVLDVVRALVSELGHPPASIRAGTHLERELGLGSLERVELLLRLEKAFGTRLDERVLAGADTVQDLISALSAARGSQNTLSINSSQKTLSVSDTSIGAGNLAASAGAAVRASKGSSAGIAEGLPSAETFQDVLRHRGRTNATQTHLTFFEDEGEGPVLTFGELWSGAERVATDLARRGIGRGDTVAIMLPTSRDFFLVFAGTLLSGATPVPIYPPFRADRIEEYAARQSAILANAGARLLVTFREAERVAKLLKPGISSLEAVATAASLVESRAAAPTGTPLHSRGDDLALLQYTSGSTGNPKGVMLTHANLLANIRAVGEALALSHDDVGVSWLPLYHDMGLIGAWLMPLYFGLPVVVLSPLAFLSRPIRWLRAVHRYRGTVSAAPNFAYELASAKVSDDDLEGLDLSSWRAALNGAEPVLPATLDRFAARFAPCGFRREALLPVYGLAEASLGMAFPPTGRGPRVDRVERATFEREGRAVPFTANAHGEMPPGTAADSKVISFVSVGSAIPRHEVRIVNDHGANAGERVEGQLWLRGPSATQGYYRNEAATAALFPAGQGEGWLNSGDRAYRAEGEIYITGRVKDIIIQAGRNLYPHEIEDVVAQVPGVRKGCVVVFGTVNPATGTERLVVVAESRDRDRAARTHITQAITSKISIMMGLPPDVVEIIPPNTIPKTSSGKLKRDAAKTQFLAGTLGSTGAPAWLQIARLGAASSAGRIRAALGRAGEIAYGCYAVALFGFLLIPAWMLVLVAPTREAAARITTTALRGYLALAGMRVRVNGRVHLREHTSCMFVSNHTSYVDVVVLMAALGVDYHFVAKDEVRSMPFVRTFVRKLGHFAFNREDPRARLQEAGEIEQALQRGESAFVFPEGTFTAQPGVRAFHLGAFKAAIAAGRPIVPVALDGTRRMLRDGTWLPRPSHVTITICPPLTAQSGASDWHEIVRLRDAAREMIARYSYESLL